MDLGQRVTGSNVTLIIIVTIVILTLIFWFTDFGKNPRFTTYISLIAIIGTVIAIYSFVRQEEFERDRQQRSAIELSLQQSRSSETELQKFIMEQPTNTLIRIYQQMYQDNPTLQAIENPLGNQPVTIQEIHFIAILFQTIEDVLTTISSGLTTLENPDNQAWFRSFESWFKSPLVRQQWLYSKPYYTPFTVAFVEENLL